MSSTSWLWSGWEENQDVEFKRYTLLFPGENSGLLKSIKTFDLTILFVCFCILYNTIIGKLFVNYSAVKFFFRKLLWTKSSNLFKVEFNKIFTEFFGYLILLQLESTVWTERLRDCASSYMRDFGLLVFSTNWDQNSGFHKVSQNSSLIRFWCYK